MTTKFAERVVRNLVANVDWEAVTVEQGGDELGGDERDQVADRLAGADELHRDAEFGLDGEHDAALGRPVELGQHDARDVGRLAELAGLDQAVLAGGRIDHQQRLGHPACALLGDAAHLAEFVHQVRLRVQPTGGVGHHEVDVTGGGPLDPVEDHRTRVAALGAADDLGARPFGPCGELFGGGGTERVAGGEQHRAPVGDLLVGELADRRGLADAVDADEHPHVRAARLAVDERERPVGGLEPRGHLGLQRVEQLLRLGDLLRRDTCAKPVDQLLRHADADVGAEQGLLEIVERLVVDRPAAEHAGEGAGERRAGLGQPIAQRCRRCLDDRFDDRTLDGRLGSTSVVEPGLGRRDGRCRRAARWRLPSAALRRLTTSTAMPNTTTSTARIRNRNSIPIGVRRYRSDRAELPRRRPASA